MSELIIVKTAVIIMSILFGVAVDLVVYFKIKIQEKDRKIWYLYDFDKDILSIISNEKSTDKEKIEAIEWLYDRIPFPF